MGEGGGAVERRTFLGSATDVESDVTRPCICKLPGPPGLGG